MHSRCKLCKFILIECFDVVDVTESSLESDFLIESVGVLDIVLVKIPGAVVFHDPGHVGDEGIVIPRAGMVTMNQSLMSLLLKRKIDMKIGFEASPDPEELDQMLRKAGV
jgi:hypothetical protein